MKSEKALENLKEQLSAPWQSAPGTIQTYLETGAQFLTWLGDDKEPSESDFRRYFNLRREQAISERTLRKEFAHLKKLALANGWDWTLTTDDTIYPEEEPNAAALTPDDIEKVIRAQQLYTESERFYLAVSTTWGCYREELARIRKRDYDKTSIMIHTAKRGQRVRHLIPDVLKPIFEAYRPKRRTPTGLAMIFHRICLKAGVKIERGYSFNCIRRSLRTLLEWRLAENHLPLSLVADYQGWAESTKRITYGRAPMPRVKDDPEVLATDPFSTDRLIYPIHPLLGFWEEATPKKRARRTSHA